MKEKAAKAVEEGKYQWGLQLTDSLLDSGNGSLEVKELRGKCLRQLALREVSAPGRNWYLTSDMEMGSLRIKPHLAMRQQRIETARLPDLFLALTCMLDAEKTLDLNYTAVFR